MDDILILKPKEIDFSDKKLDDKPIDKYYELYFRKNGKRKKYGEKSNDDNIFAENKILINNINDIIIQ